MTCPLCEMLRSAPPLAVLRESAVFLSSNQGSPGWCMLVLKEHAEHLADLRRERQLALFDDVSRVAGAIRAVFPTSGAGGSAPRINYECLGNLTAHIHWHVIPRHADDPTPRLAVWGWTAEQLRGGMGEDERNALAAHIGERLRRSDT